MPRASAPAAAADHVMRSRQLRLAGLSAAPRPARPCSRGDTCAISCRPRRKIICRVNPPRLRDPAPDLGRIHRVQHLGGFRIGHRAAVGAEIPGGVKAEIGARGDADLVVRHRAEHDGAGRGAQPVDHHGLAGGAQALVLVDIGSDSAAAIVGDPDHGVARRRRPAINSTAASNPVSNLMASPSPLVFQVRASSRVMQVTLIQDIVSVISDRVFVQIARLAQIKFKSSVAGRMHSALHRGPKLKQSARRSAD